MCGHCLTNSTFKYEYLMNNNSIGTVKIYLNTIETVFSSNEIPTEIKLDNFHKYQEQITQKIDELAQDKLFAKDESFSQMIEVQTIWKVLIQQLREAPSATLNFADLRTTI